MNDVFVHPSAHVSDQADIGEGTKIWINSQIREKSKIGKNCIISKDTYIDFDVVIGDNVKVQNGVSIYHGVTIEDDVFIGPNAVFTNDYFEITLPGSLATPAPRSPAWFGYCAALNILDAKVLFSTLHTRELFNPTANGTKNALERHHLFPKAYLASIGIADDRDRNQQANFAFIEWSDNIEILDTSPSVYMKDKLADLSPADKAEAYADHALMDGWESLEYGDFLKQRRILMARVVKRGYERLK